MTDNTDTVTIEMRRELACELVEVLDHEVARADEYHSTEQVMDEACKTVAEALHDNA
jgi:hypothetical protein